VLTSDQVVYTLDPSRANETRSAISQ
jgi:hypothetical protein